MTLERTLAHDLSTRGDGRTVFGIAVPFDREARVNDGLGPYTEVFKRGAFAKTIREQGAKVKLLVNHDKMSRLPIGRATSLREDAAGLYGEFRISATREGDEALTLVSDGVVDAFSVGFAPIQERESDGRVERTEVSLREVSLVAFPAYADAAIAGLRSMAEVDVAPDEWERIRTVLAASPELLRQVHEILGTPDVGAAETTTSVEVDGSEPADEATRDDTPAEGHESNPTSLAAQPISADRLLELAHMRNVLKTLL